MLPTSPRFKSLPRNLPSVGTPPPEEPVTKVHDNLQVTADSTFNPFGEESDSSTIAPIPFDKIVAMGTETDFNPFPGRIIIIIIIIVVVVVVVVVN